jgi:Asp-tRNA(Asn)/Glu-tRNA(Gln) amidotransferase B subunit
MTTTPTTTYETIIGLEVHVQLLTERKMFCGCSASYSDAAPNTHVCPVCMALPGVLPVTNQKAVAFTVMTGLALNCTIPEFAKFDRKNYPYPDLLKGYQISQYDLPLTKDGWMEIEVEGEPARRVGITRCHLEEDTARLAHRTDETYDRRRKRAPTSKSCGRSCATSASARRTWKRATSAATRTCRCARRGRASSAPRSKSRT